MYAVIQPALGSLAKKLSRKAVLAAVCFLPSARRRRIERWWRGREQYGKLKRADCVVVSFGKSGRTWLRVLLSRIYQVKHGLPEHYLIGFDNLNRINRAVPKIFFTHDTYLADYTGNTDKSRDYGGRKVILLVRHPADVAVSQFHQWRHRMRPGKKALNRYPAHGEEVGIFDFVAHEDAGLAKALAFMNAWAAAVPQIPELLIVRYEELRARPEQTLTEILDFLGTPGSEAEVQEAVRFASFENMKQKEQERGFWLSGGRLKPRDRNDPQSFKVRRGKVGGYRDHFEGAELSEIEGVIDSRLDPIFGYTGDAKAPPAESA